MNISLHQGLLIRQMTTFCLLNNFSRQSDSQHIPLDKAELQVAKRYVASNMIGASTAEVLKSPIMSAVPSVNNILRLALTFGASSATCESTYSTLARILTPYSSSMLHQRKADLVLLAFGHALAEKLLSETMKQKVMKNFCGCGGGRRLPLY